MCQPPSDQESVRRERSVRFANFALPAELPAVNRRRMTRAKSSGRALLEERGAHADGASVPVILHIYDLAGSEVVSHLNDIFQVVGAFHAGVEIHGREWSFGFCSGGGSGVFACEPTRCSMHSYRESIVLGRSELSERATSLLIAKLSSEWIGAEYDLIHRNCCHFADRLAHHLGVSPLPQRVVKLAAAGAAVDDGLRAATEGLTRSISTKALAVFGRALLKSEAEDEDELDEQCKVVRSKTCPAIKSRVDFILDTDSETSTSDHVLAGAEAFMDYAMGSVSSLVSCMADPEDLCGQEAVERAKSCPQDVGQQQDAGWMAPMFL